MSNMMLRSRRTRWLSSAILSLFLAGVDGSVGAAVAPIKVAPSALSAPVRAERDDPGPPQRCARLAFQKTDRNRTRPASIDDLLHLRDFGGSTLDASAKPGFAVSPDGTHVAVQVRQAEPASNTYCQALLVFDVRRPAADPVTIMLGSELARDSFTMYGMAGFPMGNPRALTPQWSPDGRWLAFVQRHEGRDGLFAARMTGGPLVPLARPAADVVDFTWASDATTLEYETNAPLRNAEHRQAQEGRNGYRYDNRFWMLAESKPYVRGSFDHDRFEVALSSTGVVGPAKPIPPTTRNDVIDHAWVELDKEPATTFRTRVHVQIGGARLSCRLRACEDAAAAWWSSPTHTVVFLRREGHAASRTAVYVWRPGQQAARRLAIMDDELAGCTLAGRRLFCGRERSASPRDIVALDIRTGALSPVVDLNPEWKAVTPARIQRLYWSNSYGIPAMGDLVLPAHVEAGTKLPLVVVQYDTRGFLRGGTGNEYPIRAMAAAGFAVLSISRPLDLSIWLARAGQHPNQKDLMEAWADRASVHDSLLEGIKRAASIVPLDHDHMAITGLSDGASTATYALIHSRLFSLALLSTCCEDPVVTTTAIGPAYEEMQQANGYPVPWERHQNSWRKMSLAQNAGRICAEIQIQSADREARMALASIAALRKAGVPIEMYLFPDEYHVKWQAVHRAAVYRRNLEKLMEWRSRPPVSCAGKD